MAQEYILFLLATFVPMVIATVLLAVLYIPKFHVRGLAEPPERVLAHLALALRTRGYLVKDRDGNLAVRLGRTSAVRISAEASSTGSVVRYQAYATPAGWGTLITLVLLSPTAFGIVGWGAVAAVLYVFHRARSFAMSRVAQLLPADGSLPAPPGPEDVSAILVTALAEGHRSAMEAYEAQRAAYWDYQGLAILFSIFVWGLLFVGLFLRLPSGDFGKHLLETTALATLGTLVFELPAAWLVRRRFRPRLLRYRGWGERLHVALRRESEGGSPERPELSTFELLAESSAEVPAWREAVSRAGLSADPASGLLVMVMAGWTLSLLSMGLLFAFQGSVAIGIALLLGGAGLGALLYLFCQRWKRKRRDREAREIAAWNHRLEGLQAEMERFLEEL